MAQRVHLEYVSPSGVKMTLISPSWRDYEVAFVVADGIEGLVGVIEDPVVNLPGIAGAVFRLADRTVQAMTGTLTLAMVNEQSWAKLSAAWSTIRPGVLRLTVDEMLHVLPVRLAAPLPQPVTQMKTGSQVAVSLVADGGVWLRPKSGAGKVRIANSGDVPISPVITWTKAGSLTLPSGARVALPAVDSPRVVSMGPADGQVVRDATGAIDKKLTKALPSLTESIPVGATATITAPAGATIEWAEGVLSPWT